MGASMRLAREQAEAVKAAIDAAWGDSSDVERSPTALAHRIDAAVDAMVGCPHVSRITAVHVPGGPWVETCFDCGERLSGGP
jgi:hypothetical protein